MSQQITTISFLNYTTIRNKIWAFGMMQFAHKALAGVKGLSFYRLMGSGKGMGFNPFPDWSVYCLLQVWDSEEAAHTFFQYSSLIKKFEQHTEELWTLYMRNISASGSWVNKNPFEKGAEMDPLKPIAVITRATIKWNWLLRFWKYVPTSQEGLAGNDGLLYTKGVGEVPIVQMATFSLWKDFDAVKRFAYSSKQHQEAISKTRQNEWYKEELFARFQPYKSIGTWNKKNPLEF
ncbi:MAG: heme-degrading monooxygenase HmoA [Cyclobacteriaceae bacterium]|jgi:heme-degrading monooxygenase HmoA